MSMEIGHKPSRQFAEQNSRAGFVEAHSEHGNFAGTPEVAEHVGRVERAIEGATNE